MGHLMFYVAVVAACLLWSAAFVAAAARAERVWLRRLLTAVGLIVPLLALAPWVALTGGFAVLRFQTNWFGPTLTAFLSALIGGVWIGRAGLSRPAAGHDAAAAAWPVVPLAATFVLAKAVAFGTLLFIDNAVAAEGRMLRVEAAQVMAANMPPVPVADEDAAPLYLRAFAALAADKTLADAKSLAAEPITADGGSAEVAEILARHAATLDLLRRAADAPDCRFVRDWSRPSVSMLLPEVQWMRQAARLLALAARREAADGDAASAIRDVVRIHRIGRHAASEPILICGLVGQAIDLIALETLSRVLPALGEQDLPKLDDTALRDFVHAPASLQRSFLGEEAFGLATVADLADDRYSINVIRLMADGAVGPEESILLEPLSLLYRCFLLPADIAGYRSAMRRYQDLVGAMADARGRPFPELQKEISDIEKSFKERREGIFTSLMAPALGGVLRAQARSQAVCRAADVLVAATRARLETGSRPESVDALVPEFLPLVPRDPYTADAPLRSTVADDGWVVYSVGPDGEDDGGPPAPGVERPEGNDDVGLRMRP